MEYSGDVRKIKYEIEICDRKNKNDFKRKKSLHKGYV